MQGVSLARDSEQPGSAVVPIMGGARCLAGTRWVGGSSSPLMVRPSVSRAELNRSESRLFEDTLVCQCDEA